MTHWFKYNLGRNEEFLFIYFLISFISNSGKAKAFKCVLVNVQIYVHYITVSRWMVIPSHRFGHISSQCFFFFLGVSRIKDKFYQSSQTAGVLEVNRKLFTRLWWILVFKMKMRIGIWQDSYTFLGSKTGRPTPFLTRMQIHSMHTHIHIKQKCILYNMRLRVLIIQ